MLFKLTVNGSGSFLMVRFATTSGLVRHRAVGDLTARRRSLLAGSDHEASLDVVGRVVGRDPDPGKLVRLRSGENPRFGLQKSRVATLDPERERHIARATFAESDARHFQSLLDVG